MRDKILFLDMDGVVNSNNEIVKYLDDLIENKCYTKEEARKQFNKEFCYYTELIFPIFAKRITDICEKTDCDIVWSTTWRTIREYRCNIEYAQKMLTRRGIPGERLISYTPNLYYNPRCDETKSWLKRNGKHVKRFAILDDRIDAKYNTKRGRFFQTTMKEGLTENITQEVIKWLNDIKS